MVARSNEYLSTFQLMISRYDGYVLIEYVRNHVTTLLKDQRYNLPYHNLSRAELIIDAVNDLAGYHGLDEEDYSAIVVSVYLVEYGHVKNPAAPYNESMNTCIELMRKRGVPLSLIRKI